MDQVSNEKIKYRFIYEALRQNILRGVYQDGQRIPTENELAKEFSTSRPTVARALARLRKEGYLERRAGSGTYVRYTNNSKGILSFGLMIPGLGESEIFEPICAHMAQRTEEDAFRLIWSGSISENADDRRSHIETLARSYIQQKLDGVFFVPLELTTEKDTVNIRIVELLGKANIPIVLLDRDVTTFPVRSKYDLVGVDDVRIGYLMTQHLIDHGCTNLRFVARPYSAPTVQLRIMGHMGALHEAGLTSDPNNRDTIRIGNVEDHDFLRGLIPGEKSVGLVCANDATAARVMHHLAEMGYDIPGQVRIVGVDDVKYAKFLRVPLTTYRQPTKDIATAAIKLMLSRVIDAKAPAQTIHLDGELVVRKSCGCR